MNRVILLLFVSFLFQNANSQVYKDKNAPVEDRVESMLSSMTLSEKLEYIGGVESFYIRSVPRLELPKIKMSDGPVGVRTWGQTTAYPTGILDAATWDTDLIEQLGEHLGMDARARGVHILLAPGVNIYRAPMCGRNFEYFGEDPYLAAQMATAYVKGVQSQRVVATVKHYAGNNQEWDRYNVSSDIDERTLQEIYLPAFKAAVKEGGAGAVMNSYNLINGVHATQNEHLNNEILKGAWGFDGILMSDWGSTHDGIAAAKGGLDLEMPSAQYMTPTTLQNGLNDGSITEEMIDDKVRRILRIIFRFGFYDQNQTDSSIPLDNPESAATSLEVARSGIVLLKNQDSILPLSTSKIKSIAVLGPNANTFVAGGGSSYPSPFHYVSILKGIENIAGDNVQVNFVDNSGIGGIAAGSVFYTSSDLTTRGLTGRYYKNQDLSGSSDYTRIDTLIDFHWSGQPNVPDFPADHFSIRWTGYIKPEQTGTYVFSVKGDDGFRLWVGDQLIIDNWIDEAYTLKQGKIKLTKDVPYRVKLEYYENGGLAEITFGYRNETAEDEEVLNAAKSSDAVVVCAGFNSDTEGEGFDRPFKLDPSQDSLIARVSRINSNTIVILEAGGNVDMSPWISSVKGLIHAFYPGQEGGTAIGEILFGITNPSGKLPASFEKAWEDNPTYSNYYANNGSNHVKYNEGVFLGYRYYTTENIEPRFPFGFGLSYTTFEYSDMIVVADTINGQVKYTVSFSVKNTGNVAGAEVAQLYVHQNDIDIRPYEELKDFAKVSLNPGDTKQVTFVLDENAFAYFKPELNKFGYDKATFELLVGSSSEDIRLQQSVEINHSSVLTSSEDLLKSQVDFNVYPSPANDYMTFSVSQPNPQNKIMIYDINGRKVDEFDFTGTEYNYNCAGMNPGIYVCKLLGNSKITTKKVVIQR